MIITFDPPKRLANLMKHGLDFDLIDEAFLVGSMVVAARGGRYKAIGKVAGALPVVMIFALLGSEGISIVSLRRANRKERGYIDG